MLWAGFERSRNCSRSNGFRTSRWLWDFGLHELRTLAITVSDGRYIPNSSYGNGGLITIVRPRLWSGTFERGLTWLVRRIRSASARVQARLASPIPGWGQAHLRSVWVPHWLVVALPRMRIVVTPQLRRVSQQRRRVYRPPADISQPQVSPERPQPRLERSRQYAHRCRSCLGLRSQSRRIAAL